MGIKLKTGSWASFDFCNRALVSKVDIVWVAEGESIVHLCRMLSFDSVIGLWPLLIQYIGSGVGIMHIKVYAAENNLKSLLLQNKQCWIKMKY
jgi:hypothetical protein